MRDESNKLFLCYAWEDMARVQQIILETEHEIDAKISSGTLDASSSSLIDDEVNDKILSSELFIVFVSDAARKSDFVIQCVTRASHLNKNILPLEIDKQGIFGSKSPQEFKFRSKTYSYDDSQSKAGFHAQLKAALGLSVVEGDAYGALVHVVTDRDARISRYGKLLGLAQPGVDCKIRLAKGSHQLQFQDTEDTSLFIHKIIDILDNDSEQFIEVPMTQLLQEKQEREEHERFQMEKRKQIEREQYERKLRLEVQRREEEEKRQYEVQRSESLRKKEEERRKAEEWARRREEFQASQTNSDNDNSGKGCSTIVGWIIGIAFVCFLISLL